MTIRPAFLTIQGEDHAAVCARDLGAGEAAIVCAARPGRKGPNEDAVGVYPLPGDAAVLVVADGMGGGACGARAAGAVVEGLAAALTGPAEGGGLDADALRGVVVTELERVNREIMAWGIGAGATVVAALVTPDAYRTIHAGDSAALVTGQRGAIKHITTAHSPVGFAEASGMLDADDAMDHDERHIVSNFLGSETLSLEMSSPRGLAARDTLLLASDGLFDNLSVDEVADLARCGPLPRRAGALREQAQARMGDGGKPDDLGMVLFRPASAGGRE